MESSFKESFPYVRCFPSVENAGAHMLGSMEPIAQLDAGQLVARMPASAQQDLLEWNETKNAPAYLRQVLDHEYPVAQLVNRDATIQVTDDQPYSEYYLLRHAAVRLKRMR